MSTFTNWNGPGCGSDLTPGPLYQALKVAVDTLSTQVTELLAQASKTPKPPSGNAFFTPQADFSDHVTKVVPDIDATHTTEEPHGLGPFASSIQAKLTAIQADITALEADVPAGDTALATSIDDVKTKLRTLLGFSGNFDEVTADTNLLLSGNSIAVPPEVLFKRAKSINPCINATLILAELIPHNKVPGQVDTSTTVPGYKACTIYTQTIDSASAPGFGISAIINVANDEFTVLYDIQGSLANNTDVMFRVGLFTPNGDPTRRYVGLTLVRADDNLEPSPSTIATLSGMSFEVSTLNAKVLEQDYMGLTQFYNQFTGQYAVPSTYIVGSMEGGFLMSRGWITDLDIQDVHISGDLVVDKPLIIGDGKTFPELQTDLILDTERHPIVQVSHNSSGTGELQIGDKKNHQVVLNAVPVNEPGGPARPVIDIDGTLRTIATVDEVVYGIQWQGAITLVTPDVATLTALGTSLPISATEPPYVFQQGDTALIQTYDPNSPDSTLRGPQIYIYDLPTTSWNYHSTVVVPAGDAAYEWYGYRTDAPVDLYYSMSYIIWKPTKPLPVLADDWTWVNLPLEEYRNFREEDERNAAILAKALLQVDYATKQIDSVDPDTFKPNPAYMQNKPLVGVGVLDGGDFNNINGTTIQNTYTYHLDAGDFNDTTGALQMALQATPGSAMNAIVKTAAGELDVTQPYSTNPNTTFMLKFDTITQRLFIDTGTGNRLIGPLAVAPNTRMIYDIYESPDTDPKDVLVTREYAYENGLFENEYTQHKSDSVTKQQTLYPSDGADTTHRYITYATVQSVASGVPTTITLASEYLDWLDSHTLKGEAHGRHDSVKDITIETPTTTGDVTLKKVINQFYTDKEPEEDEYGIEITSTSDTPHSGTSVREVEFSSAYDPLTRTATISASTPYAKALNELTAKVPNLTGIDFVKDLTLVPTPGTPGTYENTLDLVKTIKNLSATTEDGTLSTYNISLVSDSYQASPLNYLEFNYAPPTVPTDTHVVHVTSPAIDEVFSQIDNLDQAIQALDTSTQTKIEADTSGATTMVKDLTIVTPPVVGDLRLKKEMQSLYTNAQPTTDFYNIDLVSNTQELFVTPPGPGTPDFRKTLEFAVTQPVTPGDPYVITASSPIITRIITFMQNVFDPYMESTKPTVFGDYLLGMSVIWDGTQYVPTLLGYMPYIKDEMLSTPLVEGQYESRVIVSSAGPGQQDENVIRQSVYLRPKVAMPMAFYNKPGITPRTLLLRGDLSYTIDTSGGINWPNALYWVVQLLDYEASNYTIIVDNSEFLVTGPVDDRSHLWIVSMDTSGGLPAVGTHTTTVSLYNEDTSSTIQEEFTIQVEVI